MSQASGTERAAPGARATTLVVNEIFGPTVQGEGPSSGRRCAFLRLGGCNLSCRWCDTPYTWDWKGLSDQGTKYDPRSELTGRTTASVLDELLAMATNLVVISGGEPLSQQRRLLPLIQALAEHGTSVEIETNGTVVPDEALIALGPRFNVSPKLAHAGDPLSQRIKPEALRALSGTPGVAFKFVCRSPSDLDEVADLTEQLGLGPVWVMPEGKNFDDISKHLGDIADEVVRRGWNLTTRLHVLAWGDRRGV
ncbi:7-carboxy-7-deazaguanine synthase QueE [Streptomyces iconiensis]|uniref:7-carboxy-7-deazaguanine synthase n=1 Tax=Streptomyces iconiensis TaxID=1384038 RepID=A0ABT7A0B9_9ACTN|nr:7-carboxy-7-deazaguanine synthase QueE [Streptomyces iconiensis]MDJ1134775.1 7-carboxy-7-deazaguanine synthase QueE [Streptomyces iconiensis]